jgi:hypothetical protein
MRTLIRAALLISCFVLAGSGCGPGTEVDLQELRDASTAEQEAAALKGIMAKSSTLGFIAFDSQGHKLPGRDSPWEGKLHHIQIRADGQFIYHQMIDDANLSILLE